MTTSRAREVQWSELQRDPKAVAALADSGDVRVKRRDGVPLLLIREDRFTDIGEGSFAAARALRAVLAHLPAEVAAVAFREEFPWLDVLPAREVAEFIHDFVRAAQASAELGQWAPLLQMIHEWRATAEIYADPELARRLSTPITEDYGPVPMPPQPADRPGARQTR